MGFKPKAPPVMSDINVIPMADIMLVLLIIFMVVTPMLQKGMSVDLAPVDSPKDMPDADKDDAILIAVMKDGWIYIGMDRVSLPEVTTKVKDLIANRLDKTVFVKADARVHYGAVVAVVDEVRAAGVDNLGLLTEKTRDTKGGKAAAPPPGGTD
jgi:biopolymer transport protein ExbD/biopolymer transport protein TolR